MNPDAMITTLKSLKLHGMADAIETLSAQCSPAYQQAVPILQMLLKAESEGVNLKWTVISKINSFSRSQRLTMLGS